MVTDLFASTGTLDVLTVLVVPTGLSAYAAARSRAWAARGIRPVMGWVALTPIQFVGAVLSAAFIAPTWGTAPGVATAAFAWLGVLAVATDLRCRKVPWDISHPVAAVGLAAFAADYFFEGLLALGSALLGLVAVPFIARALTNKGLGMSDIRVLWACAATCSWWVGQTWLLYGLIAACLIQVPVRILAGLRNWGEMVPSTSSNESDSDRDAAPRLRRELPFAPALVTALLTAIVYGASSGVGACEWWNALGSC